MSLLNQHKIDRLVEARNIAFLAGKTLKLDEIKSVLKVNSNATVDKYIAAVEKVALPEKQEEQVSPFRRGRGRPPKEQPVADGKEEGGDSEEDLEEEVPVKPPSKKRFYLKDSHFGTVKEIEVASESSNIVTFIEKKVEQDLVSIFIHRELVTIDVAKLKSDPDSASEYSDKLTADQLIQLAEAAR